MKWGATARVFPRVLITEVVGSGAATQGLGCHSILPNRMLLDAAAELCNEGSALVPNTTSKSPAGSTSPESCGAFWCPSRLRQTAWPILRVSDTEVVRRRKVAVRAGHLTMAIMIGAAVIGGLVAARSSFTNAQVALLCVLSGAYVIWNLVGTSGMVRLVLWEGEAGPPPTIQSRLPECGTVLFFIVQTALAATLYLLADTGMMPNFVWLVLLPPIAYAVFLTDWRGIVPVTAVIVSVLAANAFRLHEPRLAVGGLAAFSFAVIFTLVFTLLAVHAERARFEVQRLASELTEANRQLREQALRAEELAMTRERNRIAREIHDSLGHYLTGVNMQLEAARAVFEKDPSQLQTALAQAQLLTQEGLRDIRHSLATLRTTPLENKTLPDALQQLVSQNQTTSLHASFELIGTPRRLSPPAELSLYRTAQEGLTNVHKHAKARHCRVVVEYEPGRSLVKVTDDGCAVPAAPGTPGFGLIGLRERANLLGGKLEALGVPGKGFTLCMEVPE